MEIKRIYGHEKKLIITLLISAAIIISTVVFFIIRIDKNSFNNYLINKDYDKLYSFIENPDFSMELFNTYMDYNYGGDIDIVNIEKNKDYTKYSIKTDVGEKNIRLEKLNDKNIWFFDDYIYDWHINVPKNANVSIGNIQFENKDGEVIVNKLPFAVYPMRVTCENCEVYDEKVMAGQKLSIKMNISQSAMNTCESLINEYLNFKKNALNTMKIIDVNCVDKESGVYREVIEQVEWQRNIDYKISKELDSLVIEKGTIDDEGIICIKVVEQWDTNIINGNGENKTTDKYKNNYFIDTNGDFKIIKIKNEQI